MNITAQQLGTMIGTEVLYEESLLKIEGVYIGVDNKPKLILGDMFTTIEPVNLEDVDFMLKPLKAIKSKDLQELLDIANPDLYRNVSVFCPIYWHSFIGLKYTFEYKSSRRVRSDHINFKSLTLDQHLFLITKGYDVYNILKKSDE